MDWKKVKEMSNSSLVNYTKLSPNCSKPRNNTIKKITIHHMAGNLSVETCGNVFAPTSRQASSNYGIGTDGRVGLYVEEKNRSWCSSSAANDNQAVTIEVANCKGAPNWEVSDAAYNKLIDLCVDICYRNGIKQLNWTGDATGNLTCHYMFAATACPGPYLKARMPEIAAKVNARLGAAPAPSNAIEYKQYSKEEFIEKIAGYVNKFRKDYGIMVASPIIAQACLESAYGTSNKAKHNNYFGLKYRADRCPTACGRFIDGSAEQNKDGSYVPITDQWFEFQTMEHGVKGYFDFINILNYKNLKGVTDPETYLKNIKADGFATSLKYVDNVMNVIKEWNLTKYDEAVVPTPEPEPTPEPTSKLPYLVKVTANVLNVRSGPGTGYKINRDVKKDEVYTIVEESADGEWGKLKSGAGWICLKYTKKNN